MIIIVDHRQQPTDTRHLRLAACLEPLKVGCRTVRQVYGDAPLQTPPAWLTEDLRNQIVTTIGGAKLVLLHCGDRQHLVAEALHVDALRSIPCLLFTGGDPQKKAGELASVADPEKHIVLPTELAPRLREDWPQSNDGVALRGCAERILSGESPKTAVRKAFGDPELDEILDALYAELNGGAVRNNSVALKALIDKRNELLEAHYEKTRGWRNPALLEGRV